MLQRKQREGRPRGRAFGGLTTACAAMGALVVALIVWRAEMVRLLPQTANFYKMAGLNVNLRGLAFKDVKVTTETVEGKQVLVIEGVIVGESKKTVDLPRLRFSVRDAQGAEDLRLEHGAGTDHAEAWRLHRVQIAPRLPTRRGQKHRHPLLQQARYRRRQYMMGARIRA